MWFFKSGKLFQLKSCKNRTMFLVRLPFLDGVIKVHSFTIRQTDRKINIYLNVVFKNLVKVSPLSFFWIFVHLLNFFFFEIFLYRNPLLQEPCKSSLLNNNNAKVSSSTTKPVRKWDIFVVFFRQLSLGARNVSI